MRPWTEELKKLYPFDPKIVATIRQNRPWWSKADLAEKYRDRQFDVIVESQPGWIRTDGKEVPSHENRECLERQKKIGGPSSTMEPRLEEDVDVDLARIDTEHPLPHPGLRCGQIWSNGFGEASLVLFVRDGHAIGHAFHQVPEKYSHLFPVTGSSVHHTLELAPLPSDYHFLIHDPHCPWLAPWASSNVSS